MVERHIKREDGPVETTTARPGEKRNTGRAGPAQDEVDEDRETTEEIRDLDEENHS